MLRELKSSLRDTLPYAALRWWRSRRELLRWERAGRPVPPPQDDIARLTPGGP